MDGVDWIAIRMLDGVRPIILKAPKLFGSKVIYIEPISGPNPENKFNLRIVDPLSTYRTEPVEITQNMANAAIKTFGHTKHN